MKEYALGNRVFGECPVFTRNGSDWKHDRYFDPHPAREDKYDRYEDTHPVHQLYVTLRPWEKKWCLLTFGTISGEYGVRIRVENLHYNITTDELYELFTRIGPITESTIVFDRSNRSTGIAFVTYPDPLDAERALRDYNGAKAGGQVIHLREVPLAPPPRSGPRVAEAPKSLMDRIERPGRSLEDRIDPPGGRARGRGDRRGRSRSASPRRMNRPAPEGVDRYVPGGDRDDRRASRSPIRRSRGPREQGGRGGRGGRGRGERREEGRPKREDRPKKSAADLDAEMDDYFGGGSGAKTQQSNGAAQAQPQPAAGDDDIDMAL
ncbi:hypothetical protein MBLNU230_g3092t2 [Neophaeotheca triangularis]